MKKGFDLRIRGHRAAHLPHWLITHASLSLHTLITKMGRVMEGFPIMHKRRIRWEPTHEDEIQLFKLAEHYLITCQTEGKKASTLQGSESKGDCFSDTPLPRTSAGRGSWIICLDYETLAQACQARPLGKSSLTFC